MSKRLTELFREVIELRWSELVAMENSFDSTNFESIVIALVRACKNGNLRAIQTALDRLDGKIATEIEVEMPKFYYLYPRATMAADDPNIIEMGEPGVVKYENGVMTVPVDDGIISLSGAPADMDELESVEEELPTGSLRAVLEKLLDSPKVMVGKILVSADAVDKHDLHLGDPKVKSVIIAGLMRLVHNDRIGAVFEIFDQIDGKVADKFKMLGNDMYMKRFDLIAPAGAVKNDDGIYQIEAPNVTNMWSLKLEAGRKR